MTVRPILQYPDPRLSVAAAPVVAFDEALHALADDLLDTMRAAPGIGVTGPHIGVFRRLTVIALPGAGDVRTYVNPTVLWASPELVRHPEGSVSMPGVTEMVERPARVRIGYHDLAGETLEEEAEGLLAVCLQHEIDQLDGIFWLRRLTRLKRERVVKRFEKLRRSP
jgi:peptide deformylase